MNVRPTHALPRLVQPPARVVGLGLVLVLVSMALLLLGLGLGSSGLQAPWKAWSDPVFQQILWDIRAPRTVGAWMAGALLGLAGACSQGVFRNPLADPFLLGSASGASLFVAVFVLAVAGGAGGAGMDIGWAMLGQTGSAFLGAVAAVAFTLVLAQGVQQTMRLLLAGLIVGMVAGAATSLLTLANPQALAAMQAFSLGSTAFLSWSSVGLMVLLLALCGLVAVRFSRVLDALVLGELTAQSLGLPVRFGRLALIAVLALATGTAVAQTGLVAFVGLLAPHLVRRQVQVNHRGLLVLSAMAGGVLLLAADCVARWALAPEELPVGLLTACLGGLYLLVLMYRQRV